MTKEQMEKAAEIQSGISNRQRILAVLEQDSSLMVKAGRSGCSWDLKYDIVPAHIHKACIALIAAYVSETLRDLQKEFAEL